MITITRTSDDLRRWIGAAAEAAGITDPAAFAAGKYLRALLRASIPGPFLPLDGVLLREWERGGLSRPGAQFGLRLYTAAGIRYVRFFLLPWSPPPMLRLRMKERHDLFIVSKADYTRLYRLAVLHRRRPQSEVLPPVMPPEHLQLLRQHTIDHLSWTNLRRIRELGGRPQRSVLLLGPPGNGKTTTCRWLRAQCQRLGLQHKEITYESYSRVRDSYYSNSAAIKNCSESAAAASSSSMTCTASCDAARRRRNPS